MRGRRTLALVLVLVALCLLSVLIVVYLTQGDGSSVAAPTASPPDISEDGGTPTPVIVTIAPDQLQLVEVVISMQTVPRGWQMTPSELAVEMRLASEVGTNIITDINEAIGLYARIDIFQGQTLTRDMLVGDPRTIGREDYGPSSLIPPGFEAMAIPMDRLSSVAYGLDAGDTIDIMFSLRFAQLDEQFQTLLPNSAAFILTDEEGVRTVVVIDPYGRFEVLDNGDTALFVPSSPPQPIPVSFIIQNAKVIQVGQWEPPQLPAQPTTTPDPSQITPTPEGLEVTVTPTPRVQDVLVIALPPQQLLLLKYAIEHNADVDFALRGVNDGQLYQVNNVNLAYLLERFGLAIPPDFNYTIIGAEEGDAGTNTDTGTGSTNGE
jgi:Flp pilus assembly protein CpaB